MGLFKKKLNDEQINEKYNNYFKSNGFDCKLLICNQYGYNIFAFDDIQKKWCYIQLDRKTYYDINYLPSFSDIRLYNFSDIDKYEIIEDIHEDFSGSEAGFNKTVTVYSTMLNITYPKKNIDDITLRIKLTGFLGDKYNLNRLYKIPQEVINKIKDAFDYIENNK